MPSCGCPNVKIANGEVRKCTCQPCSDGNLSDCTCNKETGCACTQSNFACVCGPGCSCASCNCQEKPAQQPEAGQSCCGQKAA